METLYEATLEAVALAESPGLELDALWQLLGQRQLLAGFTELPRPVKQMLWASLIHNKERFVFLRPSSSEDASAPDSTSLQEVTDFSEIQQLSQAEQTQTVIQATRALLDACLGLVDEQLTKGSISPDQERMLIVIARTGRSGALHHLLMQGMATENPKTGEMVDMKPQACHHLTKNLESRGLIVKNYCTTESEGAIKPTTICHLARFADRLPDKQRLKITGSGIMPDTGYCKLDDELLKQSQICDLLASCPDHKALESDIKVKLGYHSKEGRRQFARLKENLTEEGAITTEHGTRGHRYAAALQLLKHPVRRQHLAQVAVADGAGPEADDSPQPDQAREAAVQIEACVDEQMLHMIIESGSKGTSVPELSQRVSSDSKRLSVKVREMIEAYSLTESRVQSHRQHTRVLTASEHLRVQGPPSSLALDELASIFGKTMSVQGRIKLQALRDALKEKTFILLPEVQQIFEEAGVSAAGGKDQGKSDKRTIMRILQQGHQQNFFQHLQDLKVPAHGLGVAEQRYEAVIRHGLELTEDFERQIREAHLLLRRVNRGKGMAALVVKGQQERGEEVISLDNVQTLRDITTVTQRLTKRMLDFNQVISKAQRNGMIVGKMIRVRELHGHFLQHLGIRQDDPANPASETNNATLPARTATLLELWDSIPIHLMSQTVGITCSDKVLGTYIESKSLTGGLSPEAKLEIFDGSSHDRYDKLLQFLQNLGLMKAAESQQAGPKAWHPQHGLFRKTFELATHGRIEVREEEGEAPINKIYNFQSAQEFQSYWLQLEVCSRRAGLHTDCYPFQQIPIIMAIRGWNSRQLMAWDKWSKLSSRLDVFQNRPSYQDCEAIAKEIGLPEEQVRAISDKRFNSRISGTLGSLGKKPGPRPQGLPMVRNSIRQSGPAADVAARDAAIQEQKKAEAEARALVPEGAQKRKRSEGTPGPHRVADRRTKWHCFKPNVKKQGSDKAHDQDDDQAASGSDEESEPDDSAQDDDEEREVGAAARKEPAKRKRNWRQEEDSAVLWSIVKHICGSKATAVFRAVPDQHWNLTRQQASMREKLIRRSDVTKDLMNQFYTACGQLAQYCRLKDDLKHDGGQHTGSDPREQQLLADVSDLLSRVIEAAPQRAFDQRPGFRIKVNRGPRDKSLAARHIKARAFQKALQGRLLNPYRRAANKGTPMLESEIPGLMTVVAAELIQSMCFAVGGKSSDTSEPSPVIDGTPPKVRDAAVSLIRNRLHAPSGGGVVSYMDNLNLKLQNRDARLLANAPAAEQLLDACLHPEGPLVPASSDIAMADSATGVLDIPPETELPAAIPAAILGQVACGLALVRPCHVQVDVATLMTQHDEPGPDAAGAQAQSVAQKDVPLVVLPNRDMESTKQDQWCLPGLPRQSCIALSSETQDTEVACSFEQDSASGGGAHGETSAGLQYWSSRLLSIIEETRENGISLSKAAERLRQGMVDPSTKLPCQLHQLLRKLEGEGSVIQVPGFNQQMYVARVHGDYYMLGQGEASAPDVDMEPCNDPTTSSLDAQPDANAQDTAGAGVQTAATIAGSQTAVISGGKPFRPWLHPDGNVNYPYWRALTQKLVSFILHGPGTPEDFLVRCMSYISPQAVCLMLERLVACGVLHAASHQPAGFVQAAGPPSFLRQPSVGTTVKHYFFNNDNGFSKLQAATPEQSG
ncbi:hypothetical protein WJX84_003271 [Apatococcus fuscideae]|uniref:B-block binding subunit of TFIIIC domain-containing protein n=1 Tax=Apatococcus fuscideae TaxID=2026836 RepID=A0AAW1SS60_9CHLO